MYRVGVMMRLTCNHDPSERCPDGLVTVKPGKHPVVGSNDKNLNIHTDTYGLAIEHVGYHTDRASCWHVLIDNDVLLVWDHDMVPR